jgi:hypothetical protein
METTTIYAVSDAPESVIQLLNSANTGKALDRLDLTANYRKIVWVKGMGYLTVPPGYDVCAIVPEDLKYDNQVARITEKKIRRAVK